MLSLKQKQSGFTIVELLIVIVIIGILAGLVITTFVGIQAKARDSERKTDINAVQKQVEAYYATNGGYPSLADLNSVTFRNGNSIKLDIKAVTDPNDKSDYSGTSATPFVSSATSNRYSYAPLPASCVSPTTSTGTASSGTFCDSYTLTAVQEVSGAGNYVQKSQ